MAFVPTVELTGGEKVVGHEKLAAKLTGAEKLAGKAGEHLSEDLQAAKKKLVTSGMSPEAASKTVMKAKKLAAQQLVEKAKAAGQYEGRPLQPGAHSGDGDFKLLRDKLVTEGHSPEAAQKIAGKVANNLAAKAKGISKATHFSQVAVSKSVVGK